MNEEMKKHTEGNEQTEEAVETIISDELEVETQADAQGTDNQEENKPSEQLDELKAKLDEAENRYLRLYADFENFRRRARLDQEAGEKYRAQSLMTNLLPAIDNLERAIAIEPENEQTKALLEGVKMVYRAVIDALKQEGAEQIEAVGVEFDPNFHQAVMQIEDEQYGSNIVIEEFQKGYKLKDRVIRPSMVKVNR
ncbi:nucleotide exchange factor GrpE [Bacillus niameyensis]|uniref:nucleotide exchange factor GrpE n=1 Tax=Bacillus niameyensis TaxID=1522308 RepID=UPI000780C307|nr:nucleotide exchange factor GrpE [Bacillus niameyensis]